MEFEFFSPKSLFKISNANITPQFLLLPKVPFLWAMGGPFQGLAQDFTQKTASLLHPSFLFNFWIICSVAAFQLFMEFSSTPQPPLGVPRLLFHCWLPCYAANDWQHTYAPWEHDGLCRVHQGHPGGLWTDAGNIVNYVLLIYPSSSHDSYLWRFCIFFFYSSNWWCLE